MVNTSKRRLSRYWACIWIVICIVFSGFHKSEAQGLRFNSNDSLINKRSSYDVFRNQTPKFDKELNLSFDLSIWDLEHFGYILNITDKQQSSFSLTYIHSNNQGSLYFNIDGQLSKLKIPLAVDLLKKNTWMKVRLKMDLDNDSVTITLNNKIYKAAGFGFRRSIAPKIVFGKNDHYTDVPNMAIRNLEIKSGDETYSFPLNEWRGNEVHNKQGDYIGHVSNPNWLINESYFWSLAYSTTFNSPAGLNFDAASHDIVVYGKDSLTRFNVPSRAISSKSYANQMPLKLLLGKSVWNERLGEIYIYEVNPQVQAGPALAALNLKDLSWKTIGRATLPEQRHHHNAFYVPGNDEWYLFGGYGGFAYHNDIFKYNKKSDHWDKLTFTGDVITPRFFSAAGSASNPNEVYVFGGYGNKSGNQAVGAVHYYDLYRLNLKTRVIKKCWEIKPDNKHFVPANNLIFSKDGKFFYALCYPQEDQRANLKLYRFSVADGKHEIVSSDIPVTSERIESDVNLFFDKDLNQFICAIQEFTSPEHSRIKVLLLSNPPVSSKAYLQGLIVKSPKHNLPLVISLVSSLLFLAIFLLFVLKRNKTSVSFQEQSVKNTSEVEQDASTGSNEAVQQSGIRTSEKPTSIHLLGEFSVFGNEGKNITNLFSPKIQQLFVLILLNSKDGKGVTSKKISSLLWPEKELVKTKNIRGVTINHLRSILVEMDGVELTYLNDHYCFTIEDKVSCDYFKVKSFLSEQDGNKTNVQQYLPIMLGGGLLPAMQDPWIDDFKNSFDQSVIERITPEMEEAYKAEAYKLALDLSRIVLKVDPFNDHAIKYQLNALRRVKGKDMAYRCFQQFKDEYETSLGTKYPLSFDELCR
jgi:DNA-binding SARP family transcriptional activator